MQKSPLAIIAASVAAAIAAAPAVAQTQSNTGSAAMQRDNGAPGPATNDTSSRSGSTQDMNTRGHAGDVSDADNLKRQPAAHKTKKHKSTVHHANTNVRPGTTTSPGE